MNHQKLQNMSPARLLVQRGSIAENTYPINPLAQ